MAYTDKDFLELQLLVQKQSQQIEKLQRNNALYYDIISNFMRQVNIFIGKGVSTGKFYKISSVELNNIKTALSKITK